MEPTRLPPTPRLVRTRPRRRVLGFVALLPALGCGSGGEVVPPDPEQEEPGTVPRFEVAVSAEPSESAVVTGGGTYEEGVTATVSAAAAEGYRFLDWSEDGAEVSTASTHSFVVDRDRTLVARSLPELEISVAADPSNGGTVEGGGVFLAGEQVGVLADPRPGHLFEAWEADGEVVSREADYHFEASRGLDLVARVPLDVERGKWAPGGTYSDWYFADPGYESLEWTFVAVADPPGSLAEEGLLHYYAYTFGVTNATGDVGGGYAGFQTNGIIFGAFRGKVVNFSIWGSNGGHSDGWVEDSNVESGGYQIMYPYAWSEGGAYRFELRQGPGGVDDRGKWWGLWVTDLSSGSETFIGEQRVPAIIDGRDATLMQGHTAMFGEDLHWWRTLPGVQDFHCGDFEPSSMAAVEVTAAGGTVRPVRVEMFTNAGQVNANQVGRTQTNCNVEVRALEDGGVQHVLGYWPDPAPPVRGPGR